MDIRPSAAPVFRSKADAEAGTLVQAAKEEATASPVKMIAHISMRGDVTGRVGEWLGEPGSGLPIEGLLLLPPAEGPPSISPSVECQIHYSKDIRTPWTPPGIPCGSGGLALGCQAIRFRMTAETATFFSCHYDIAFTDGTRRVDVPGAEIVRSPSGASVEAIKLQVLAQSSVPVVVFDELEDTTHYEGDAGALNDHTIRLRLLSPAFKTHEPDIRNGALIPEPQWRAMAISLKRGVFSNRVTKVRQIDNAIVAGEGLVFDRSSRLVPGTNLLMADDIVEKFSLQAREVHEGGVRRIAGLSLLCKTRAAENFGHFLVDMFPKAWLARQLFPTKQITYIIQNTPIVQVAVDALVGVGINPFSISVTDSRPVLCEALLVIDGLTSHGVYQSPISIRALTDLAEAVPAGPHDKIYVRRDAQSRALLNQDVVENVLRERGFAVVDPGKMRLAEQIAIFKGATTIVGPLGAALTNIAFCPMGSRVIAITSQSFPDTFFWFISQHRKHEFREVRGVDVSGTPEEAGSWISGFTISEEDLDFLRGL